MVAEVALSLLLLVGASLFVRSFFNLKQTALGFDTTPLMTLRFFMPNEKYTTPDAKTRRVEDVMRRIEGIPGVQAAFASNMIPLAGGGDFRNIVIDGRSYEKGKEPGIEFISRPSRFSRATSPPAGQWPSTRSSRSAPNRLSASGPGL